MRGRKRIRVKFESEKSDIPIIKILFGERKECYALLDTGSEQSLFDNEFVKQNKLLFEIDQRQEMLEMKGLTETNNTPVLSWITLFRVGEGKESRVIPAEGVVFDLSHISDHLVNAYDEDIKIVAILGNDFLSRYNVIIDYEKREITL